MALIKPEISLESKSTTQTVVRIDVYDPSAAAHNLWRSIGVGTDPSNGVKIGDDIDPTQLQTDVHGQLPGETLRYALESVPEAGEPVYSEETEAYITKTETGGGSVQEPEAVDALYEFLVENNLLTHVRYGIAPYAGQVLRDDAGTLYASKAFNFKDNEFEPEQTNAANQYKLVNGIWHLDGDSIRRFPIHEIRGLSLYTRVWYSMDYVTDTANPNHEFIGQTGSSNDGMRVYFDSDRTRSDMEFTDGSYGSRQGVFPSGWALHEIMFDYDTALFRWRASRATFESNSLQTSQRTAGTEFAWGSGTGIYNWTPRGHGNLSFPSRVGSVFMLTHVPSDAIREAWYNLDKARYGY